MPPLLFDAVSSYARVANELYGHYLDTTLGFSAALTQVCDAQTAMRSNLPPGTLEDDLAFFYGHGDPNDPEHRLQHRTTQGEFKARNAPNGPNEVRASQFLIVLLYEYWESVHRAKVAAALALPSTDDLKIPIFGDLRILRHDVIHHVGVIRAETVKRLERVNGFRPGQQIGLTGNEAEALVGSVYVALDSIVTGAGHPDPGYRWIKTLGGVRAL
jgi:hypothetical protein